MNPNKAKKCGVCARPHFERNNYYYGKQFTVRDLTQEQSYFNDKRWLINRMVLGWGVVCGLEVTWDPRKRKFLVGEGMALDCCGHEIVVCEPQEVAFEEYDEHCGYARKNPKHEQKFVLCLEYHECKTEPVDLPAVGCDDQGRTEFNRVRDSFKLTLKPREEPEPKPDPHLCINRFKHDIEQLGEPPANPCRTETIHEHLCHKLTDGCPECECSDCVVLATIYVKAAGGGHHGSKEDQKQQGYSQEEKYEDPNRSKPDRDELQVRLDTCVDRKFVYNNQLLYDLIYCHHGDLPHIVDFNWRKLTANPKREIDWDSFVKLVQNGLTVYFDQEMTQVSLTSQTFFLSFLHEDPDSGNVFVKRIPAEDVKVSHDNKCCTATWWPDKAWFNDELISAKSQLRGGVVLEVTLRSSRIWDERGKALDGAFLRDRLPTGNGTQGTEFIDWFRVLPRGNKKAKAKVYEDF